MIEIGVPIRNGGTAEAQKKLIKNLGEFGKSIGMGFYRELSDQDVRKKRVSAGDNDPIPAAKRKAPAEGGSSV